MCMYAARTKCQLLVRPVYVRTKLSARYWSQTRAVGVPVACGVSYWNKYQ